MAKFLNSSATNYFLDELIKGASDRLILISPLLKLNDRMKELLADKNWLKIDMRIAYGKSELQPQEIEWLRGLTFIRTIFCKSLHAKCYINEEMCIVTSLNLYEFSQVNNNEMGSLIQRADDSPLYNDAHEEAQRIIGISDEVRILGERISREPVATAVAAPFPPTRARRRQKCRSQPCAREADFLQDRAKAGPEDRPVSGPGHRTGLSGDRQRPALRERPRRASRR